MISCNPCFSTQKFVDLSERLGNIFMNSIKANDFVGACCFGAEVACLSERFGMEGVADDGVGRSHFSGREGRSQMMDKDNSIS